MARRSVPALRNAVAVRSGRFRDDAGRHSRGIAHHLPGVHLPYPFGAKVLQPDRHGGGCQCRNDLGRRSVCGQMRTLVPTPRSGPGGLASPCAWRLAAPSAVRPSSLPGFMSVSRTAAWHHSGLGSQRNRLIATKPPATPQIARTSSWRPANPRSRANGFSSAWLNGRTGKTPARSLRNREVIRK